MKKKNVSVATKADVEEVAMMAQGEFRRIHEKMSTKDEMQALRKDTVDGFQWVTDEFRSLRQEMQEGFRMVLAAIETVEYTKLRMRID